MLSETGYTRKTYAEILEEKEQLAKDIFGEDIDTSDTTPLGKFLRITAYQDTRIEEVAEQIYYSRFPNYASGVSLDRLCVFVGISRNPAIAAAYKIRATGTAGKPIPYGFLVSTKEGITYYNAENDVVFNANGEATFTVECTDKGEIGNVPYAEITTIVNPDINVTDIEAIEQITIGTEIESDYSLRQRFNLTKEGLGSCNEDAIIAAVLAVPTVTSANIIVNDTNENDSTTNLKPHTFQVIVTCPATAYQEVAEAIFSKKPIGISSQGSVSRTVVDASGNNRIVYFSVPQNVTINVNVSVKVDTSVFATIDGEQEIKKNIESYINGLGTENDVSRSALYGVIHDVTGVLDVTDMTITANGKVETGSVDITYGQIAYSNNIEVTINV